MRRNWFQEGAQGMNGYQIADLVIGIVLSVLIMVFIFITFKRKKLWVIFGVEIISFGICFNLGMKYAADLLLILFALTGFISLYVNNNFIRNYIVNPISGKATDIGRAKSAITDENRQKLNKSITTAVKWLSDNKTGAIMTFERNTNLDKYIQSGTVLNAPVTAELLETIFYEGTRLHDGAIVIRGDTIVAAACFFPATQRTLVGKFGARHRAAIGISELTDSVTIVVSEETGRISVAFSGSLEPIKYDEFEKVFSTFMLAPSGTVNKKENTVDLSSGSSSDDNGGF
jgi:uncharacterized protein (TIGR00159 family)